MFEAHETELGVHAMEFGSDSQRFDELLLGAREISAFAGDGAECGMGDRVVARHGDGLCEQRLAVAPMAHLQAGGHCERERGGDACAGEESAQRGSAHRELARLLADRESEPDQRQIHVAVGARLRAHLNEPDHRHERAQEPEPAHEEMGLARGKSHRQRAREHDRHNGRDCRCALKFLGVVGVEHRESARPDRIERIRPIAGARVERAIEKRNVDERGGTRGRLRSRGHRAHERREREDRELLDHGVARFGWWAAQRPVIEQQQREWKRHGGRLGEH